MEIFFIIIYLLVSLGSYLQLKESNRDVNFWTVFLLSCVANISRTYDNEIFQQGLKVYLGENNDQISR